MAVKTFKFFWTTHKWAGIIAAVIFVLIACTGFLLLLKKEYAWIQPPTMKGAPGEPADFITAATLFDIVLAEDHPDFQSLDDVDRVDFRPGKRIYKVQSQHNYMEMQVDAVTGDVLHVQARMSDLLENLHDGSFFGDWVHAYVFPIVALVLLFLVFSGLWLWIEPIVRRRRRKARAVERV